MKNNDAINIIIAGGAGFWAEQNHYPAIIKIKKQDYNVRVSAIVDNNLSNLEKLRPHMNEVVKLDNPNWISPFNKSPKELKNELTKYIKENKCHVLIVATNPIHHFFYCKWAIKNNINVICDKPLVVTQNSSSSIKNAKLIQKNFEKLENLYKKKKKNNPHYMFCTPLRRRALTPFLVIAHNLKDVYEKTGEGIRYMNVIINGGLHRYPTEFLKGGAHGYLDGVGSLAHSSYHYIDVIAWYLQIAPGEIKKINISMPYVFRVKDYLSMKGYKNIKNLIEDNPSNIDDNIKIPSVVNSCELDFTFHLQLLNGQNHPIGLISFTSNHTTYSPRQVKFNPNSIDPAHDQQGGRMSQLYIDIHQGALQNWQLIKNDVVFFGNEITTIGRIHPKIGNSHKKRKYSEAYEKGTISPQDLLINFILYSANKKLPQKTINLLTTIDNQRLTNKIFSKSYELIAFDYEKNVLKKPVKDLNHIINIDDFR